MATKTRKKERKVETEDGRVLTLATPKAAGLVPCTGEAHSNPYIDNCMLCAPRWGEMMSYEPVPFSALMPGVAVAFSDTGKMGSPERTKEQKKFEEQAKAAGAKLTMVTERRRGSTCSFFAWVLPE